MKYLVPSVLIGLFLTTSLSADLNGVAFKNENWTAGSGTSGSGAFGFDEGSLKFTAGGSGLHNSAQMLPTPVGAGNLVGYLNQSWTVQVRTHIDDFGPLNVGLPDAPRDLVENPDAQGFMAQLIVNSGIHNGNKGMYVQAGYDVTYGQSVAASAGTWGGGADYTGEPMVGDNVLLRADYNAFNYTLSGSVSFDDGATWMENPASFDVRSGWGLAGDDTRPAFVIMLVGVSHNLEIGSGAMTFDNFQYTGLSAIPEPSTYAALAGLGALGLAIWRRRQTR